VTEEAALQFVADSFRSAWPLELLLVLRQEPLNPWDLDALVRELRASTAAVSEGLVALRRVGFVGTDAEGRYCYAPRSPEQDALAAELASLYNRKPRAIMRVILSAPNDRIQTFADAFRLRKDES
jgi:hypothetical protein